MLCVWNNIEGIASLMIVVVGMAECSVVRRYSSCPVAREAKPNQRHGARGIKWSAAESEWLVFAKRPPIRVWMTHHELW